MHVAARNTNVEVATLLIDRNADVNLATEVRDVEGAADWLGRVVDGSLTTLRGVHAAWRL